MLTKEILFQEPAPGCRMVRFRGDVVRFRLQAAKFPPGRACVRTNLGQGRTIRREIIRHVELNEAPLARDWFDIPMKLAEPGVFEVRLPLNEVGHFEAKCLYLPDSQDEPLWPEGPNTTINVEPADTVCGNSIYNAFVRQFGPQKNLSRSDLSTADPCLRQLDADGYTVIPPSGTFRDLIAELDFILGHLGCRFLQLLPIHPTPTTYARMGRFGSPYAALSFTAVDPALAVFDPAATPLEQFIELVDAVHAREGKVIIDIAINHTGWAASLHETHPQWLARNADGEIENPGAWGVVWEDLTRLDYRHKGLWRYMADVFLTWCRRGVDGFRCDAGYMIPTPAWRYIIAKVRDQFPDALFLLEGLGGKIEVTRDLLNRANFNWAYSELFQNYDRGQIEWYLPEALEVAASDGPTVHFAETHDNNRLAATSACYARMRTALCALAAPHGAFGFANGVEWLATEKINVHEACALNWGAADNQVAAIARLNRLLKIHPAFGSGVEICLIGRGEGHFLALGRHHQASNRGVVVLVNLDAETSVTAGWDRRQASYLSTDLVDLLSETPQSVKAGRNICRVALAPGQVLCLADADDPFRSAPADDPGGSPSAVVRQRLRAKALEVMAWFDPHHVADAVQAAAELHADPEAFCRCSDPTGGAPRTILWRYPEDLRRQVMVPPDHFLLVRASHPFRARIVADDSVLAVEQHLIDQLGGAFILFVALDTPQSHILRSLEITIHTPDGTRHHKGALLFLADGCQAAVRTRFSRNDCHQLPLLALGTNGRGAMMRMHADWRHLASRYDALLAANLHPAFPVDRHILLTRCRAWIVYQGYSQEVKLDYLEQFGCQANGGAWWRYQILTGQGEHIVLQVRARMARNRPNAVALQFERFRHTGESAELADDAPVTLVIRPDIEDRNFHHCTKAFAGPEALYPRSVHRLPNGFRFAPEAKHALLVEISEGQFAVSPEWYYMVHRPMEAERGLDPDSDLFSPGYFTCRLTGGQKITLTARAILSDANPKPWRPTFQTATSAEEAQPLETALSAALDQYVVRRGAFNTVIAGFPWFLDWGRDTLIVVRGLVAAGKLATSKTILLQFAQFEDRGTLPNMIRGDDAGNRDTSDAPLWFFTACADLVSAEGDHAFLDQQCGGRTVRQILIDMATALIDGTPNGIRMDPESGLIYSPSHFTWMDTNYPAGTPRQGYPIEIQALWHAAVVFLGLVDGNDARRWTTLAERVSTSIADLFWHPQRGYLSDCLHARPGQPAAAANADDHLRPNQLLAVTLGAVTSPGMVQAILRACQCLLVPGAIRSLADRPVVVPLAVERDGTLLNNPKAPYWGRYLGDEDTCRKPAYHNGTAWTWPFPLFCEAWVACYGASGRDAALAWLSSSVIVINSHCVGHVPEILDGDAPHHQRGCDAQAWGVSELLRVWKKLTLPTSMLNVPNCSLSISSASSQESSP